MKKYCLILLCFFLRIISFAQTATDADGNKLYGETSVAIFTRFNKYELTDNGLLKKVLATDEEETIRIGLNVMATSGAQQHGVRVCNRDDATFKAAQSWIDETKGEDYIDGLATRAKKIGATHIMIQDITLYDYTGFGLEIEIAYNVMCVLTNIADHSIHKYFIANDGTGINPKQMMSEEKQAYRNYLMSLFPNFFVLQGIQGKTAFLAAASLFGMDNSDKVYFYDWQEVNGPIKGHPYSFSKMTLKAIGTSPCLVNGLVQVKLDKAITPSNNLVIKLGDINHCELNTYVHVPTAVKDFNISGHSFDDYCRRQINNALYKALSEFDEINIIEDHNLSLIKDERELQKTEDFIDGSVIEQFKVSGAFYIIVLQDFSQSNQVVKFRMSVVNVSNGTTEKDFSIISHISNIYDVMNYYVSEIFIANCAIIELVKQRLTVYALQPIVSSVGETFNLLYNKPIKNPLTNETLYNRVNIAECKLTEWNGQEYILQIEKVIDLEDFNQINNIKSTGLFFLQKKINKPIDPTKNNSIVAMHTNN